jgi:hypothetical protein
MSLRHFGSVAGVWLLLGCSSSADPLSPPAGGDGNDVLEPPPAGQGLQLKMVSTIAPGHETERCKFFQVPAEGMNVNRAVVRYVPGSHHVLLYRTSMTSIPTQTRSGQALSVDENGVFDCAEGAAADWDINGVVAGAQSPKAPSAASFPAGVAAKLEPGAVLIINTHYLNASSEPLVAEARLNLYTLADKDVVQEGGFLFFYNPFIRIPARSAASSRLRCTLNQDITLVSGQSHMHRRGVGYVANIAEPSTGQLSQIYESHDWEDVPLAEWSPGMSLRAGQAIDFTCQYQNTEDRQIAQGATTKDEMCMFLGNYYPRNVELEGCGISSAGGGATFIGTGAADGKTTLECLNQYGASEETTAEFYGCVQDSCPAIGEQVTGHLKCQITATSPGGGCAEVCSSGNPMDCGACMNTACGAATSALATANCN